MIQNTDNMAENENSSDEVTYGLSHEEIQELTEALDNHQNDIVLKRLESLHVADIAQFVELISHDERKDLIEIIKSSEFMADLLVELDIEIRKEILEFLGSSDSARIITEMDTDDAVDVLEDLSQKDQDIILAEFPEEQKERLEESLSYPEDSAGRLVDEKLVSVPEFWTVGQLIDFFRSDKNLPDIFHQVFIVDPKLQPIGSVMLSKIMRSPRDTKLKSIMSEDLKLINVGMDQEEVAYIFRQYALVSAPVVNDEGRMVGVITIDDIVDVIEEEAHEDIMRLGGVGEGDLHSDFLQTMRRRFPWLAINLITAIVASTVIGAFEGQIQQLAILAILMPISASMGGNAGTQTLTVAVRAIATKELTTTNSSRVIGKEIMVGLLNGIIFAIITGSVLYLLYDNIELSIVFATAIISTLLIAGFAGAIIPLSLSKFNIDPAVGSGVILTTITDVTAFASFLGFATMILL